MKHKKQIPVWAYICTERIYVLRKTRAKLNDLYPQRAILEEARKESKLIQANDWIDHHYYEDKVEQMYEKNQELFDKYGAKLPNKDKRESKPMKSYNIPEVPKGVIRKIGD